MSFEDRERKSRREFLKGAAAGAGIVWTGAAAEKIHSVVKQEANLEKTNSHWLTPAAMKELSKVSGLPYDDIERIEPDLRRAIENAILQELRRDTI